ncbi:hypothetical protein KDA23_03635 [Candidatus Saccharibacteria bacterium]|nr:hypothetical protein [Candidatus Saccharibacteria bacterium]
MNFFRDKNGKVVLGQTPNVPIVGWALFRIVSWLTSGQLHRVSNLLATAFLFTWAYLELTDGVNYFRRTLGGIVLAYIIYGFF